MQHFSLVSQHNLPFPSTRNSLDTRVVIPSRGDLLAALPKCGFAKPPIPSVETRSTPKVMSERIVAPALIPPSRPLFAQALENRLGSPGRRIEGFVNSQGRKWIETVGGITRSNPVLTLDLALATRGSGNDHQVTATRAKPNTGEGLGCFSELSGPIDGCTPESMRINVSVRKIHDDHPPARQTRRIEPALINRLYQRIARGVHRIRTILRRRRACPAQFSETNDSTRVYHFSPSHPANSGQ